MNTWRSSSSDIWTAFIWVNRNSMLNNWLLGCFENAKIRGRRLRLNQQWMTHRLLSLFLYSYSSFDLSFHVVWCGVFLLAFWWFAPRKTQCTEETGGGSWWRDITRFWTIASRSGNALRKCVGHLQFGRHNQVRRRVANGCRDERQRSQDAYGDLPPNETSRGLISNSDCHFSSTIGDDIMFSSVDGTFIINSTVWCSS